MILFSIRGWCIFFFITFLNTSVFAEPTVSIIQKKLKVLGFYYGVVDGQLGSKTHAAIRRYQIKNHLSITGELNEETLSSLNIQVPIQNKVTKHSL